MPGLSRKDTSDPAPFDALGEDRRNGFYVYQRLLDLLVSTRTRPGFLAKHLNRVGIPAPHSGKWTWLDVRDAIDRERRERVKRGDDPGGVARAGPMRVGPCGSWERSWG